MCVAGSVLNSYIVKESIVEVLQNLQHLPLFGNISIERICTVIKKVYEKISQELCSIIAEKGLAELIIGGYCPESKKVKVFKYFLDTTNYPIRAKFQEILKSNSGIEFIGSGKSLAKTIYANNPSLTSLHIIKKLIQDNSIDTIGGSLQYGNFENKDFIVKGVQDYQQKNKVVEIIHHIRGINYHNKDFLNDLDCGLVISKRFVTPFKDEIIRLND